MAPRARLWRILRNKFVAGLIILVPIVVTAQALWWLFSFIENQSRPLARAVLGREIPGMGLLTTIFFVLLTGLLFSAGPLRRLLTGLEDVIEFVPLVGVIYGSLRKVLHGFGNVHGQNAFKRFVFARLPGRTMPGFLTGTFELKRKDGTTEALCAVYIPTNHLWFGDVVMLDEQDVIETDLSVEDGISLVLSAGAALPATIGPQGDPSAKP